MIVVLYPWSYEIVEPIPRNNYLNYMQKNLKKNNIQFINLYDVFLTGDSYQNISDYFIFNDVHYNAKGYKLVTNNFFKKIKKKIKFKLIKLF